MGITVALHSVIITNEARLLEVLFGTWHKSEALLNIYEMNRVTVYLLPLIERMYFTFQVCQYSF